MTDHDRYLEEPYQREAAQDEAFERAAARVTEDEIIEMLDPDNLAAAHEALAKAAWVIGKLLNSPNEESLKDVAALELLSQYADRAADERDAAIEACAKRAMKEGS